MESSRGGRHGALTDALRLGTGRPRRPSGGVVGARRPRPPPSAGAGAGAAAGCRRPGSARGVLDRPGGDARHAAGRRRRWCGADRVGVAAGRRGRRRAAPRADRDPPGGRRRRRRIARRFARRPTRVGRRRGRAARRRDRRANTERSPAVPDRGCRRGGRPRHARTPAWTSRPVSAALSRTSRSWRRSRPARGCRCSTRSARRGG